MKRQSVRSSTRRTAGARRATRRPMTFADLMAIERISEPAVFPDGRRVAFTVSRPDPQENKTRRTIRLLDLETGAVRELTPGPGNHSQPAISPDGRWIAFISDRDPAQGAQLWVIPVSGGEARRLTSGYGGASGPHWAPDSRRIAFVRALVVSADYRPGKEPLDPKKGPPAPAVYGLVNPKSSARVAERLLFRHWDAWRERRRNHLFLVDRVSSQAVDLTPGEIDVPPLSLGSARDYDFHPEGKEIAFAMNPEAIVARSTNNCIFLQTLRGIRPVGAARCISVTEACDCHPRYTRDGAQIAYLGMQVPGYEADRARLKLFDRRRRTTRVLLSRFDRNPGAFELDDQGRAVLLAADRGRQSLYRLELGRGRVRQLTAGTFNGLFRLLPGRSEILVTRESIARPADFYLLTPGAGIAPLLARGPAPGATVPDAGARVTRLTRYGEVLERVALREAEEFWYPGAERTPIHGFLVKPPRFSARRRYPLILLIHGGPQSAFADHFHYRWNAPLFAARGAVVALLNPRGSVGYGQRFTDQISGDWGGRCYRDILRGVDWLLARHRFLDPRRLGAAGASFGGFMVNWIAGHTDRFRALVSHDGIFQAETMAYTTDELWFDEHEHGGLPHEKRRGFLKFSPHLGVAKFRTPMLVVQGEQDFRCPVSEGLGIFTALQTRGVPSRLLYFPDEGHWVTKPANAEVWYDEVVGWLMRHLKA